MTTTGARTRRAADFLSLGLLFGAVACAPPPCPTGGTNGQLVLENSGLPAGVEGKALARAADTVGTPVGPGGLALAAGEYTVTPEPVAVAGTPVRTAWLAPETTVCVRSGQTSTAALSWARIATSGALWTSNGSGGQGSLLGFSAADLAATASRSARIVATGPAGKTVAFDRRGNLWALGPTVSDPHIVRVPASGLAASGVVQPDVKLNLPVIGCLPALAALAFDADGALYAASTCANAVYRLAPSSLTHSAEVTSDLTLTGLAAPEGLAFDAAGNLWIAERDGNRLRKYTRAALSAASPAPERTVGLKVKADPADTARYEPSAMAFDLGGNLWVADFAANALLKFGRTQLEGTGDALLVPQVRVTAPVTALLEGLAFDEEGALWTPHYQGALARYTPAQLAVSTDPGAPTQPSVVVSSADLGYAAGPAFFPAPAASPLFHRLP